MAVSTIKYINKCLKIKTKQGALVSFDLNAPQRRLAAIIEEQAKADKPIRVIILKARQMGFSTLAEAIIFKECATKPNKSAAIIAHDKASSSGIFEMTKTYYDNLPRKLKVSRLKSNAKELVFNNKFGTGLNSRISVFTAGGKAVGRSTTLQYLHISELAFWGNNAKDIYLGLAQCVPNVPGSIVIIESTANGFNYFRELWNQAVAGDSDFVALFVAWYELEEYRSPYDGFELSKEEEALKSLYGLDNEQLAWRRNCISNECGGDAESFKQEYPSNPEEAFLTTGKSVFDKQSLVARQLVLPKPIAQGYFEYDYDGMHISNIRWVHERDGIVKVWCKATKRESYIIGGDTAGDGSDFAVGQAISDSTGMQVAQIREECDEDVYTRQMYCLGMYYNTALLAIESNFSTYANRELARLGYPNLYVRQTFDTFGKSTQMKYGFNTNSVTRPLLISKLQSVARDNVGLINDWQTIHEMLTFVKNARGRAEAVNGEHDDCVMALGIAQLLRADVQQAVRVNEYNEKSEWDRMFDEKEEREWTI